MTNNLSPRCAAVVWRLLVSPLPSLPGLVGSRLEYLYLYLQLWGLAGSRFEIFWKIWNHSSLRCAGERLCQASLVSTIWTGMSEQEIVKAGLLTLHNNLDNIYRFCPWSLSYLLIKYTYSYSYSEIITESLVHLDHTHRFCPWDLSGGQYPKIKSDAGLCQGGCVTHLCGDYSLIMEMMLTLVQ